jgi:hypothetical protein
MSVYLLSANLNELTEMKLLAAEDAEQAMMQAIPMILDFAFEDKTGPWAVGHVRLSDESGNVVAEMEAK